MQLLCRPASRGQSGERVLGSVSFAGDCSPCSLAPSTGRCWGSAQLLLSWDPCVSRLLFSAEGPIEADPAISRADLRVQLCAWDSTGQVDRASSSWPWKDRVPPQPSALPLTCSPYPECSSPEFPTCPRWRSRPCRLIRKVPTGSLGTEQFCPTLRLQCQEDWLQVMPPSKETAS